MANREKVISNVFMGLYFFLSGVEYAVILPTLNGFLLKLEAKQAFLGLVMSAFSLSGLVAGPIFGRITDRTRSTKLCVIIGNIFEIVGNIMYFMSTNKYMVLFARLIAGVGSGTAPAIFGMVSRTTSEEERTAAFSLFMSLRQIGLIVGPAFNLFLHSMDFNIGRFHIDEFTSPGFLMAIFWFIHTILLVILYKNPEKRPQRTITVQSEYEEIKDTEDKRPRTRSRRATILEDPRVRTFTKEFFREEVLVCIMATFLVMFSQTGLETAAAPLTLLFFNWGGLQNSYFFSGASIIAVSSFIALGFLSKKFSDRGLILWGCFGMVVTYAVFFAYSLFLYMKDFPYTPSWVLPVFIFDSALLTISIPLIWVPHAALFSKVTSAETQAFNQGIRMVFLRFGQILGPLWAAPLATEEGLWIMVGVNFLLMVTITGMVWISYGRLLPETQPGAQETRDSTQYSSEVTEDDNAPLLKQREDHSAAIN